MNMKKNWIALGAALMLGLTGCGSQTAVNAEQAGMLSSAAASSDKFAGVVVSENAVEITRDTDKQIEELYVAVGDTVRINEKLFEYDTDVLSLAIDKQELEMDKLDQQIKDLKAQITDLDKQLKAEKAKKEKNQDKDLIADLERTRQTANLNLTEAEYTKKTLQAEINYNKDMLKNAVVRSPIKGTVRAIDENGSPYITIQQDGAYQVKGILNELSLNAGIMEGASVIILSRTDSTAYWTGEVSLVDYTSAGSNDYDEMFGGGGDGMSTSTSYPFYITLEDTDGLLLGQHVYIQLSAADVQDDLLRIPEGYIMDIAFDDATFQTVGTVWGVDMEKNTLMKVTVTLGEYDPTYGTYVIHEGLTAEDYIANPADPGVREGAAVALRSDLEYMGQTEPTETTAPTGSAPVIDELQLPTGAEDSTDAPVSGGSMDQPVG